MRERNNIYSNVSGFKTRRRPHDAHASAYGMHILLQIQDLDPRGVCRTAKGGHAPRMFNLLNLLQY